MGSGAFRTPVRAGKPRSRPGSICVRFVRAYHSGPLVGQAGDKNRRPCNDIPDHLQGRRGLRMLGQRRWPGLSRRGAVYPRTDPSGKSGDLLRLFYLGAHTSASRQPPHARRCQDARPRAQGPASAILGACHVTRVQRHATVFNAHSRPFRKTDFSAENQRLSPPSHRKPRNTLWRDMVPTPSQQKPHYSAVKWGCGAA